MFDESLRRISASLEDTARVLDVGGWARPLNRADWVLDLMPHESRGMLGHDGEGEERFGPDTWVTRDICAREPWPFEDGFFDFAVCSHTLEDVRDPVWVCAELQRVARAGYVEVPSRLEEQSWDVQGPWVGWGHHHWLIELEGDRFDFLFKPHHIHSRPEFRFPGSFWDGLTEEQRVLRLWWEGGFSAREVLLFEPGALDADLSDFVAGHRSEGGLDEDDDGLLQRARRALSRR